MHADLRCAMSTWCNRRVTDACSLKMHWASIRCNFRAADACSLKMHWVSTRCNFRAADACRLEMRWVSTWCNCRSTDGCSHSSPYRFPGDVKWRRDLSISQLITQLSLFLKSAIPQRWKCYYLYCGISLFLNSATPRLSRKNLAFQLVQYTATR